MGLLVDLRDIVRKKRVDGLVLSYHVVESVTVFGPQSVFGQSELQDFTFKELVFSLMAEREEVEIWRPARELLDTMLNPEAENLFFYKKMDRTNKEVEVWCPNIIDYPQALITFNMEKTNEETQEKSLAKFEMVFELQHSKRKKRAILKMVRLNGENMGEAMLSSFIRFIFEPFRKRLD